VGEEQESGVRSQELGFRRQESGGGYMGQGKGAIVNCELLCSLSAPLGTCRLSAGPFDSSRSWQDFLHRRLQWTRCRPRQ
jgi:hypothetical protein